MAVRNATIQDLLNELMSIYINDSDENFRKYLKKREIKSQPHYLDYFLARFFSFVDKNEPIITFYNRKKLEIIKHDFINTNPNTQFRDHNLAVIAMIYYLYDRPALDEMIKHNTTPGMGPILDELAVEAYWTIYAPGHKPDEAYRTYEYILITSNYKTLTSMRKPNVHVMMAASGKISKVVAKGVMYFLKKNELDEFTFAEE